MKKIDIIVRVSLILIVVSSLVAIVLQIVNEKTNAIETAYEIIAFTVGIVALTLVVFASLDGLRNSRELKVMAREIRESLHQVRAISHDNEELEREMNHELRIDEEILRLLREHGVSDDKKRRELASHIKKAVSRDEKSR